MILFVRISFTAQTMALQRAMETTRPRSSRLFDDPLARDFLRGPLRAVADLAALPVAGRVIPALYDLIWPGPRPSAAARARLIDDTLARARDDGIAQVVLLGAGFDTRAWRLPAIRRARVIEVDRPETQQVRSVARAGEPWTFGVLPATLPGYLAARGFALSWDVSKAEAGRRYFGPAGRRDRASRLYRVALAEVRCQS